MTSLGFQSTAAFATRARSTAASIERATFVTFSLGGRRFAAPVETVERVLRWTAVKQACLGRGDSDSTTHVPHAGRDVPFVDLAAHLALVYEPSSMSRVLVLGMPTGWLAAVVDAVHEIATVDAASIKLVGRAVADQGKAGREPDGSMPHGVRGIFMRHGHGTMVIDIARALGLRFN